MPRALRTPSRCRHTRHASLLHSAYFASRWARQYCGQIWATDRGLEIDSPTRLIPWGEVAQVKYKTLLSTLQPFYVIQFKRGSRLAFYACDDVERVAARFASERS